MDVTLLHSTSPTLLRAAGILTLLPASIGLIALSDPARGLRLLNFPPPSTQDGQKLAHNLLLLWVSRDFFMAAVAFAAWYNDDRNTLGCIFLASVGVACFDGIMSQRQIGKDAWKHMIWIPLVATIGMGLLGWFDKL